MATYHNVLLYSTVITVLSGYDPLVALSSFLVKHSKAVCSNLQEVLWTQILWIGLLWLSTFHTAWSTQLQRTT